MRGRRTALALLVGAAVMIALGVAREEDFEMLQKATRICLECLGIA